MKRTVAFAKAARNVFFHILTQCNLRCRHCYVNPSQHGEGLVPGETIEKWLQALADPDNPTNVIFLGGEPTMHPHLPQAIRAARRYGYASVTVDTNGYLFHDVLNKVTPGEVDFFSFSLDGPEPSVNDPIRGDGSFLQCTRGMKQAARLGFTTSAIYTVSAQNLDHLEKMPPLLADLGISRFFIQVIGLRGQAAKGDAAQVSWEQWINTVPQVAEHAASLGMTATFPKVYLDPDEPFQCAGNVARNYFVFPNGRVYQCPLCEDFPIHSLEMKNNILTPVQGIHEAGMFTLSIAEGCVMNKLIQPDNIQYDDSGRPIRRIACCLLKQEVAP